LGSPEHRGLAREAVRESLVLLKNEGGLLPLRPDSRLMIVGAKSDDIGAQCGGWSLTWQGTGNSNARFPAGQSILAGIRAAVERDGGSVTYSADGEYAGHPDAAIVVVGEAPYAETKGDLSSTDFGLAHGDDLALLRKLKAAGLPVVTVFLSGRPLWTDPLLDLSTAFVAAWLPGTEGGGIADLILRPSHGSPTYDFRGRLGFSWPSSPDQVVNLGDVDASAPRFPYGFGLTYGDASHEGAAP
jgi:beta-glucosidase